MHTMQARANPAQHISSRPLLPGLQARHRGSVRCAAEQPEQRMQQPSALEPMTSGGDMALPEVLEIRLAALEEKQLADEAQASRNDEQPLDCKDCCSAWLLPGQEQAADEVHVRGRYTRTAGNLDRSPASHNHRLQLPGCMAQASAC